MTHYVVYQYLKEGDWVVANFMAPQHHLARFPTRQAAVKDAMRRAAKHKTSCVLVDVVAIDTDTRRS